MDDSMLAIRNSPAFKLKLAKMAVGALVGFLATHVAETVFENLVEKAKKDLAEKTDVE